MQQLALDGKLLLSPSRVLAGARTAHPDVARCNSLLNPLGRNPAKGLILLARSDLDALDPNGLHTLTLTDDYGHGATAAGLVFSREPVKAYQTNNTGTPGMAFVVELADARWRVHNPYFSIPVQKQYNVLAPGWNGDYYADSLNSGSPWTWSGLVGDLWGFLPQLGAFPGLPVSPDGTPTGYAFPGVPCWPALCRVLWRCGCAVAWNPAGNTYSVVQVGGADTAALGGAASRLIHDAEFRPAVRGRAPEKARVLFHRVDPRGTEDTTAKNSGQWQTSSVYSVDVAGNVSGSEAGTRAELWDDLPALYDGTGTLTNAAALSTRAAARAADYFRMLTSGGSRMHKVYSGAVPVSPGPQVKGVAWRTDGQDALVTEVVRHPFEALADGGQWGEQPEDSTALYAPDYRPTQPIYPPLIQTVKLASGTPSGGFYDCTLERSRGDGTFVDRESVWALELAAAPALTRGDEYPARLIGYASGRPLYEIRSDRFLVVNTPAPVVPCDVPYINYFDNTLNIVRCDTGHVLQWCVCSPPPAYCATFSDAPTTTTTTSTTTTTTSTTAAPTTTTTTTVPPGSETFSAPGTSDFTVPDGVTSVAIECWGSGGDGADEGGDTAQSGGGGGGGGYSKLNTYAVTPGATLTVTVRAGGSGGSDTKVEDGVTRIVYANGGNDGTSSGIGPGVGGAGADAALTGDVLIGGQNGGDGGVNGGDGGNGAGPGGAGTGATGGLGGVPGDNGATGTAPGGGGGGAGPSCALCVGGAGADGQVTISWV